MRMILTIAWRNLVQARRRTGFLVVGLAFVTFMLVVLQAFSRSVGENLLRAATTLSSGHVNVAGFNKDRPSEAAAYLSQRDVLRAIVEENLPGVKRITERMRGWVQIASETDSLQSGAVGIDFAAEPDLVELLPLAAEREGREGGAEIPRGDVSQLVRKDAIVIFASQAKQLNVTVGDRLTVISTTPEGTTNTLDVEVVAVAQDISMLSAWTVFLHNQALRDLYRKGPDTTGALHIFLNDPDDAENAMARLRTIFGERGYPIMEHESAPFWAKFETVSGEDWIGQKLDITVWRDEVSFIVWIIKVIDVVSFFLVAILMIIIGVGVTNTMWIAVRERTNEVGTLRAIGMSNGRVLAMFVAEAAILGLGATTLGGLLGAVTAVGVDSVGVSLPAGPLRAFLMSDRLHLYLVPVHVLGAIVAITSVTMVAALWPAIRASRLQPITAIHHAD